MDRYGWLAGAATGLLALAWSAGCNTVEGVGRDLEAGGKALAETSRDVRGKDEEADEVESAGEPGGVADERVSEFEPDEPGAS